MTTVVDRMMRSVTKLISEQTPTDEGGAVTLWANGPAFPAVLSANKTGHERQGEHDEPTETANLTTYTTAPALHLFDVVEDAEGRTWRVVAELRSFPAVMSVHYRRYKVERWDLP